MTLYWLAAAIALSMTLLDLKAERDGVEPRWRTTHISNLCLLAVILIAAVKDVT